LATKQKKQTQFKTEPKIIGPKSRKQEMYIQSEADVVIFGGGK
jgi:hypothetical protein